MIPGPSRSNQHRVERYQRKPDGTWSYEIIENGMLSIDCVDLQVQLAMADLDEDVVLEVQV